MAWKWTQRGLSAEGHDGGYIKKLNIKSQNLTKNKVLGKENGSYIKLLKPSFTEYLCNCVLMFKTETDDDDELSLSNNGNNKQMISTHITSNISCALRDTVKNMKADNQIFNFQFWVEKWLKLEIYRKNEQRAEDDQKENWALVPIVLYSQQVFVVLFRQKTEEVADPSYFLWMEGVPVTRSLLRLFHQFI